MVTINGKTLNIDSLSGVTIVQKGNKTFINGVDIDNYAEAKTINIQIVGDVSSLSVDNCNTITIKGNTGDVESNNGNIIVEGSISGNAETTNGNIKADTIQGKAKTTNGSIKANTIYNK